MSDEIRTITLTDRPPVRIKEESWPLIASAQDREWDGEFEFQANRKSRWFIGVRQHEDGLVIVYATYSYTSNWQGARGCTAKRGVMIDIFALRAAATDAADLVKAIRAVAASIAAAEHQGEDDVRWDSLEAECIADLPAEELA